MLLLQLCVLPSQWFWMKVWGTPMGSPQGQQSLPEAPLLLSHLF